MKHHAIKIFKETLKKNNFSDYLKYTYVNVPHSDFINKFVRAIGFVCTDQVSNSEIQFSIQNLALTQK